MPDAPATGEPDSENTRLLSGPELAAVFTGTTAKPGAVGAEDLRGFRMGHGAAVLLDRPAIVGRRPRLPRVITGRPPLLVRVPSPTGEVSSSHLDIRQVGSTVVVTDLHSTNGTIVRPPAGEPRTLRQGESVVVSPGTLIDIGENVTLEILPPRKTAPTSSGRPS